MQSSLWFLVPFEQVFIWSLCRVRFIPLGLFVPSGRGLILFQGIHLYSFLNDDAKVARPYILDIYLYCIDFLSQGWRKEPCHNYLSGYPLLLDICDFFHFLCRGLVPHQWCEPISISDSQKFASDKCLEDWIVLWQRILYSEIYNQGTLPLLPTIVLKHKPSKTFFN